MKLISEMNRQELSERLDALHWCASVVEVSIVVAVLSVLRREDELKPRNSLETPEAHPWWE